MLNWQCFRCLNIAQPGLRHEILIIQFANIFHFFLAVKATLLQRKKKKAQHKKHELLFTGKGTESGNLFHVTLNVSKSIWQFLQTFNCRTQKVPWSFADWGMRLGVDAERDASTTQLSASRGTESRAHLHHHYTYGLKRSCLGLRGYGKECASWLVNLLIQVDFFINQQLQHCSSWNRVLAVKDKNYCLYPFSSLEKDHLYFVQYSRICLTLALQSIENVISSPTLYWSKETPKIFLTSFCRCVSPSADFRESLQWPDLYVGNLSSAPKIQPSAYWIAQRHFNATMQC